MASRPRNVLSRANVLLPHNLLVILLVSTTWPQRALVRAQLEQDTKQQVIATESEEGALQWLATTRFALVILDTQGIPPTSPLVDVLRQQQVPLVILTGAFDRGQWSAVMSELNVRSVLTRPILIGELSATAKKALSSHLHHAQHLRTSGAEKAPHEHRG